MSPKITPKRRALIKNGETPKQSESGMRPRNGRVYMGVFAKSGLNNHDSK
jgi:hypothetical protein